MKLADAMEEARVTSAPKTKIKIRVTLLLMVA
jgi:hypothetical protein